MTHDDFVSKHRAGQLAVYVDESTAPRVMHSTLAAKRFRVTHMFWSLIWYFCLPAAIACFIWVTWWMGLFCLFLILILPGVISKRVSGFVVGQVLEDPVFFEECVEADVLRIFGTSLSRSTERPRRIHKSSGNSWTWGRKWA